MLPALLARARNSGFLAQKIPQCCGQLEVSFSRMRLSTQGSDTPAGSTPEGEEAKPSSANSWREWADSQLDSARQGEAAAKAASEAESAGNQNPVPATAAKEDKPATETASPSASGKPDKPAKPAGKSKMTAAEMTDVLAGAQKHTQQTEAFASYGLLAQAIDAPRTVFGSRAEESSPTRVAPFRLFFPGQSYTPQELNPYAVKVPEMGIRAPPRMPPTIPARVVLARADFRDPEFLASFITETGRLVPRRRTKLPAKLHKHVAKQVKTARMLGLLRADAAPERTPRRQRRA